MMTPAAEVAIDVLLLLRRGHVASTIGQLQRLPKLVADDVSQAAAEAYQAGYEQGRLDLAREITGTAAKPKQPRAPRRHEWLAQAIANPETRERAKRVLRLDDELLDRVAAGGVQLSPGGWRRLRRELGDE